MDRSNLATPFVGARVADPSIVAPLGFVLRLTVMLSATFISCPDELRNETSTGNVSPGRAYGNRSTRRDNPATVPAVVTAWPASAGRNCPGDRREELQPLFASTATLAPSANRSLSRFTEVPPFERICVVAIWSPSL